MELGSALWKADIQDQCKILLTFLAPRFIISQQHELGFMGMEMEYYVVEKQGQNYLPN